MHRRKSVPPNFMLTPTHPKLPPLHPTPTPGPNTPTKRVTVPIREYHKQYHKPVLAEAAATSHCTTILPPNPQTITPTVTPIAKSKKNMTKFFLSWLVDSFPSMRCS